MIHHLLLTTWLAGTAFALQHQHYPTARRSLVYRGRAARSVLNSVEARVPAAPAVTSRAGRRFDAMLDEFRAHSAADIGLVVSPSTRGLLKGASAAIRDVKIKNAFRVLYEDLGPVRVAGDLVFSKLEREMAKSKASQRAQSAKALGRDDACVVAGRRIFDAVDADASGTVSSAELLDSDLLRSLGQCRDCSCDKVGNCQSVAKFMAEIDSTHPEGELHFDEFLVAAHHFLYEGDASRSLFGGENAGELVDELLAAREGGGGRGEGGREGGVGGGDKYSKRFDAMCDEFSSWESGDSLSRAEERNPRLALVLEGCFAGTENPDVVGALKILYMDFGALRLAGDLIFKMMKKLVR